MNMPPQTGEAHDREIVITRTFDAPRDRVWRAWGDPAGISRWWGPRGFSTTTHSMDLRPGGVWRFTMHGPDGRDYENQIEYVEVLPQERITYRHAGLGDDAAVQFHTTVVFEKMGTKTQLTLRMVFPSKQQRDQCERDYGAVEGGLQTVTRLGEHLAQDPARAGHALAIGLSSSDTIVFSRCFDAPPDEVFECLTQSARVRRWLTGPPGWSLVECECDPRVSGEMRYAWSGSSGERMVMRGTFVEIDPSHRIVHTERFETGCPDQAGEQTVTTTLAQHAERPVATTLTLAVRYGSAEARDQMLACGIEQGMGASYQRLADELARDRVPSVA